ncbi:hypothetical protein SynBIOSE41_00861 [Synechococcus sp. BIOS-E4-1]|nr:hypothetical protein SynBIOSE41_00861 [Synechococcus sp. BIOS-E4-1]
MGSRCRAIRRAPMRALQFLFSAKLGTYPAINRRLHAAPEQLKSP